jgi:MFS family permease
MISGFLQLWNLILAAGAAFSVDRLGRRVLFKASCLGMLASYIVISGLSGSFANTKSSSTGIAVIPFLFLFYGFYDIAFTPLLVSYPCEIWPFSYRAKGISMALMTTQLAVFFNIFVNPIALEAIQWKYYLVYVAILIGITAVIWFFYPETNGHSLEEMARIFDGDRAEVIAEGVAGEAVERRLSVGGKVVVDEKISAREGTVHVEEP